MIDKSTPEDKKRKETKDNIDFFARHLTLRDLKVIEATMQQMAQDSKSYNDWKYNR